MFHHKAIATLKPHHSTVATKVPSALLMFCVAFSLAGGLPEAVGQDPDAEGIVDEFHHAMRTQWHWVRENKQGWKLTDSGLQVLIEPGNLWGGSNDAKNVLLHPIPKAWQDSVEVSVEIEHHPQKRWEQVNLSWYYSDSTMVKLGLEIEHGITNIVMGREEKDRAATIAIIPYEPAKVQLRLLVEGDELQGFYRQPGADQWLLAGKTKLPTPASDLPPQVSLQFYQGEANSNRWATVRRFEMQQP